MKELIACCGLDCETCEGRIATINNDDNLRKEIAEKWKVQHGAEDITPEMINCTGCRIDGAKIGHCAECEIRKCVHAKGYGSCGDCNQLEGCAIVGELHKFVPQALENLRF